MKTRIFAVMLAAAVLLMMSACGSSEESAFASASAAASSETESSAEASASEEESSAEASSVEEEEEPTVDELFDQLLADTDGACVKLQCYDHRGTPIRNAQVIVSSDDGEENLETDFSGYVLLGDLKTGTEYTLTLTEMPEEDSSAETPEAYGTVRLILTEGSEYAGGTSDQEGIIEVSVADGSESAVDMAMTAADENGTDTSFELSRVAEWAGLPEE